MADKKTKPDDKQPDDKQPDDAPKPAQEATPAEQAADMGNFVPGAVIVRGVTTIETF